MRVHCRLCGKAFTSHKSAHNHECYHRDVWYSFAPSVIARIRELATRYPDDPDIAQLGSWATKTETLDSGT